MMKKLLFSSIFLMLTFIVKSQTLSLVDGDSIYIGETATTTDASFDFKAHIKNISADTATVKWVIDSVYNPNSWGLTLCDKATCKTVVINETNTFKLDSAESSLFKGGFNGFTSSGSAYFKSKIITEDSTDPDLFMIFKADIIVDIIESISTFKTTSISIYPNPATSFVQVNVSGNELIEKIIIYNVLGKTIKEINSISESNRINVENYPKGLYIIKLFGENNSLYHTQSFVKK